MSYLIHFNGNHSSKNGQFITGDGDGDGIIDDQHNDTTKRCLKWVANNQFVLDIAADIVCSAARKAAGYAFSKTKLAKEIEDTHIKEVITMVPALLIDQTEFIYLEEMKELS